MKKVIFTILFLLLVATIFAQDIEGIWKYEDRKNVKKDYLCITKVGNKYFIIAVFLDKNQSNQTVGMKKKDNIIESNSKNGVKKWYSISGEYLILTKFVFSESIEQKYRKIEDSDLIDFDPLIDFSK